MIFSLIFYKNTQQQQQQNKNKKKQKHHTPHTLPAFPSKASLGEALGEEIGLANATLLPPGVVGETSASSSDLGGATGGRSKDHPKIIKDTMEIIGDVTPPRDPRDFLRLLSFKFFFFLLALDLGCSARFFRSQLHHMRAVSRCSPTLLFQLVHDPVPQRNSQIFNCLKKLEVIKVRKHILQTS